MELLLLFLPGFFLVELLSLLIIRSPQDYQISIEVASNGSDLGLGLVLVSAWANFSFRHAGPVGSYSSDCLLL